MTRLRGARKIHSPPNSGRKRRMERGGARIRSELLGARAPDIFRGVPIKKLQVYIRREFKSILINFRPSVFLQSIRFNSMTSSASPLRRLFLWFLPLSNPVRINQAIGPHTNRSQSPRQISSRSDDRLASLYFYLQGARWRIFFYRGLILRALIRRGLDIRRNWTAFCNFKL